MINTLICPDTEDLLNRRQVMNAEQVCLIGPHSNRREASFCAQAMKFRYGIFVGILGVDGFARLELVGITIDMHAVIFGTLQEHFDAAMICVINRLVCEIAGIEIRTQSPIDVHEHIQIKFLCDTLFIVIGTFEDSGILLEIYADQQTAVTTYQLPDLSE